MKTAAIIAEYNPFHKGHEYHIQKTKKETGADYIIIIMSGDYTQRGEPAVFSKHQRAKMALCGGADLCLELPAIYSCSSADYFARGAINILKNIGVTDILSFGSENGRLSVLKKCALILADEPEEYSCMLKKGLSEGKSYPLARNNALKSILCEDGFSLCAPNDILSVEYLKYLYKSKSSIIPYTVKRQGNYHSLSLSAEFDTSADINSQKTDQMPDFSSASAIRNILLNNTSHINDYISNLYKLDNELPSYCTDIIRDLYSFGRYPLSANDFSEILSYTLLSLIYRHGSPTDYFDISKQLSDRISKQIDITSVSKGFENFCHHIKNKSTTYTHISRALMHIILDMTNELPFVADSNPYASVLGFKKSSSKLLNSIKKNTSIPLITKPADAKRLLSKDAFRIYENTILASHIYEAVLSRKYNTPAQNMYRCSPIIL